MIKRFLFVFILFLAFSIHAQNMPHIGYAYPAGGQQGTTFEITVGGQFLDGATNIYISGWGVRAKVLDYSKPLTQQQFNNLRDELKTLQDKRAASLTNSFQSNSTNRWTDADEKAIAEIRKKLENRPNRFGNPAIAEKVTVQIEIAPTAEPGDHELRVRTPQGLSNPRIFSVGQLSEFSKPPAKATRINRFQEEAATPPSENTVTLPTIVNGQIMPGGMDSFRFQARKGQHLVAAVRARDLIPYLPDAVPGWFQASLTLFNERGEELQHADHFSYHPDPVLYFEVPEDGEYGIKISDSIYRGREDFVYRIEIGELPYVTSIFPLGAKAGEQTKVELRGWNLSTNTLALDNKPKPSGIYTTTVGTSNFISNPITFAVDTLPECMEKEPNHTAATAQSVTLPIIINGRIGKPGEWDVYQFQGRAGAEIVAEVYARRLNSPLDSVLKVTDSAGKQLAFNDDFEDKGSGLDTHHADSRLSVVLPADGKYFVHIGDAQRNGGTECGYRLRISQPQPDFALRVVPSSVNMRGGASVPLTVYALRKDGFTNQIDVILKNAFQGFTVSGGVIPANQDKAQFTLSSSVTTPAPVKLSFEGRATIAGRTVSHPALPAEDMMQAFLYRHLVPSKDLFVDVTGRFAGRFPISILSPTPIKLSTNGTAVVRVSMPPALADRMQLELSDPPEGIALGKISKVGNETQIVLQCDAEKLKPGTKGNLIIQLSAKGKGQGNTRRNSVASLPAIPFETLASNSQSDR